MTRFPSTLVALAVLAIGLICLALGVTLVPSLGTATERGILAPWLIVWTMIAIVEVCVIALAGFLFTSRHGATSGIRV